MKDFLKQNITIVLAFTLPLILILVVVLSTYLPSLFITTDYNFVYTLCTNQIYSCNDNLEKMYTVESGKLIVHSAASTVFATNKNAIPTEKTYPARLFLHDTKSNTSREVSLEEAQSLNLNGLLTSPDGVSVSGRYKSGGGDFFLFGGSSSSFDYYLVKGNGSHRLNLIQNSAYYYQNNFQFIGWIVPGRN